ncbi:histone-lysine N-methyltransferase trithorax-like protein [Tasmannia lanceolata]|uniref:histone-lysine N-methyltransferase trithorax-like protein n=1 Tax=Tasmannia lanceolata TaxID=3420 RepID=UPI0040632525
MTCSTRTTTKQSNLDFQAFSSFPSIYLRNSLYIERAKTKGLLNSNHTPSAFKSMKREGRQHGMVRSNRILPPSWTKPKSKVINKFDSPPTAGLYTKTPSKPTNHSKFTGKCGRTMCPGCHTHPVCKSSYKAKGTHKLKSCDVAVNHRLASWRVVDKGIGLNYTGKSATGMLDHLSRYYYDENDNEPDEPEDAVEDVDEDLFVEGTMVESRGVEEEEEVGPSRVRIEEDGDMGFFDVVFVWDFVDDNDDWCLVGEM